LLTSDLKWPGVTDGRKGQLPGHIFHTIHQKSTFNTLHRTEFR